MWWTGYETLAKFEVLAGNYYPDAIDAMNSAMRAARPFDNESHWRILTRRADYHFAVQDYQTAHADLEEAMRLRPNDWKQSADSQNSNSSGPCHS